MTPCEALKKLPRARDRRVAARLRPGEGPEAAGRRPRARQLGGRPRARVGASRPRRRLHLARHVGHADHAARARVRVPVPVELGQPRRRARPAHPLLVREPRSCRSSRRSSTAREADRKGGHLARRRDGGGLVLRETAQVPDEDQEAFEDVERAIASSTPTTSGSTCARSSGRSRSATACSGCR